MVKITQKAFIEAASFLPASLIRAVVRQCGGWEEFQNIAKNVVDHGAWGGFSGFTYHTETSAFTKRNKKAIIAYCEDFAQGMGENLLGFIAGFGCLKGATSDDVAKAIYQGKGEECTSVLNALAWYALEEVARAYSDFVYEMGV